MYGWEGNAERGKMVRGTMSNTPSIVFGCQFTTFTGWPASQVLRFSTAVFIKRPREARAAQEMCGVM